MRRLLIAQSAALLFLGAQAAFGVQPTAEPAPAPTPHPLAPVLAMAEEGYERLENEVRDYTCRIVRRERVDGRLRPYEFINAKIRHGHDGHAPGVDQPPFSVYLNFLKPRTVAGREVLYVEGRDAGRMLVRRGGKRLAYVTTYLTPDSHLAMEENRYPITDIGFHRLVGRLIEVINQDMRHGECKVQLFQNAKVAGRACTRVLVEHPVPRDHFRFHRALVFIDDERQIPIAYASYSWPTKPGGKPVLLEEYIYTDVKLNVGLTDEDFSRSNPDYGFLRKEEPIASR